MSDEPQQPPSLGPASISARILRHLDALPAGTFRACPSCATTIYEAKLAEALFVCPDCSHHFPLDGRRRVELLVDAGPFVERGASWSASSRTRGTSRCRSSPTATAAS